MRKTVHFLMALFAISFASAQTVGDVFTVNNIKYEATSVSPNQAKVLGFDDLDNIVLTDGKLTIPLTATDASNSTVYDVTAIGFGAFSTESAANRGSGDARNNVIEEVGLPTSVVTIEAHGFRKLTNLKAINLENIVSTGSNCLNNCTKLTEVDLSSLVNFGQYTFVGNDLLTSIDLPSTLTDFGVGAIFDLDGLGSVNIPSSVINIGKNFMRRCDNLSAIQLNWTDLTGLTFDDETYLGDLTASDITLYVPVSTLADYQMSAFNIAGVNIVEGTLPTTFVGQVFTDNGVNYQVTSLAPNEATVTGGSVAVIDVTDTVTNEDGDVFTPVSIAASAFKDNGTITTVSLPSTITVIPNSAFRNCDNLTSLDLDDIITIDPSNSISRCAKLADVSLPLAQNIGNYAFVQGDLETISIPSAVILSDGAFRQTKIETIDIPATVTTIGVEMFRGCASLTSITVNWDNVNDIPDLASDVFRDVTPGNITLNVPVGSTSLYAGKAIWQDLNISESSTLSTEELDSDALSVSINGGVLNVSNSSSDISVSVYDITGRLLVNATTTIVDISSLTAGVYIVKVTEGNAELVKRFVK